MVAFGNFRWSSCTRSATNIPKRIGESFEPSGKTSTRSWAGIPYQGEEHGHTQTRNVLAGASTFYQQFCFSNSKHKSFCRKTDGKAVV
jgi:hypothetical protein